MFLREPRDKHHVEGAPFLVDGAPWLQAVLYRYDLHFQYKTYGKLNVDKCIFKELEFRTNRSTIIPATLIQ